MKPFEPLLACNKPVEEQLKLISFPCFASPKIDGIRGLTRQGTLQTRSLKEVPNRWIREQFQHIQGLDGELVVGRADRKEAFDDTGAIRRLYSECDIHFYVFDCITEGSIELPFIERSENLKDMVAAHAHPRIHLVEQRAIFNREELLEYEAEQTALGYEGLIVRGTGGAYKFGRSTGKDGIMFKVKRFLDGEAIIVGFEERMRNENEATTNELGRSKRSGHQAGLIGRGDLGAFVVEFGGLQFNIGTGNGLDDATRAHIWANRERYLGGLVNFRYMDVGMKQAPRQPIAWRFRMKEDL